MNFRNKIQTQVCFDVVAVVVVVLGNKQILDFFFFFFDFFCNTVTETGCQHGWNVISNRAYNLKSLHFPAFHCLRAKQSPFIQLDLCQSSGNAE